MLKVKAPSLRGLPPFNGSQNRNLSSYATAYYLINATKEQKYEFGLETLRFTTWCKGSRIDVCIFLERCEKREKVEHP